MKPKKQRTVARAKTPEQRVMKPQSLPTVPCAISIMAVDGAVAIPRHALLRLALLLHDIKRATEVRHAQAA